ncbi:MAG: hypothetical protein CME24_03450 [Gemmatimonadetes bacterium]|nr:hypothetical protein [Gemmatimonadota bacterium]
MVLLLACVWPAITQALERAQINTWATTTYYLGYAEFADKVTGQIRITAADRYTLYLNGDLVGIDDDPGSVETYEVEFKKRTNMVAVVVEHGGVAGDYGLFCVLQAEGVLMPSSPTDRVTPWFWTDFTLDNEENAAWTKLKFNKLSDHEVDDQAVTWRGVQAGSLEPARFAQFADLDLTKARSVAGFPGGLDGSQGGMQLRSFEGQNLAFNTFSSDPKIIDGSLASPKSFPKGARILFEEVEVDLGRLFPLNGIKVITQPPGRTGSFEDNSLRGYDVLISKDGVNYLAVGSQNQIGKENQSDFRETAVGFPTIIARYVRMVVTEFANRNASPSVGELEVFGEGFDRLGTYLSPALDFGSSEGKNFDRVLRFGDVSVAADMAIQFRSGDDGENWSGWSAWSTAAEIELTVPEPRRFLQFRLRMQTPDAFVSPRLDSLVVIYDTGSLPASVATASIVPPRVSIGVDTTFTYSLGLEVDAQNSGIDRLIILTPWPAQLDIADVSGGATIAEEGTYATGDSLVIAFDPPIVADTQLEIPFTSRLISASHTFQGFLFAPSTDEALSVQPREGEDPLTALPYSVVSEATSFDFPILQNVRPYPAVFTPNDDGINDRVGFGFTLGRVSAAPARVEIYDLAGNQVRVLSEQRLDAGFYAPVAPGVRVEAAFSWDGRTQGGELQPPGLYLYRLIIDIEPDAVIATGVVGIAY